MKGNVGATNILTEKAFWYTSTQRDRVEQIQFREFALTTLWRRSESDSWVELQRGAQGGDPPDGDRRMDGWVTWQIEIYRQESWIARAI